MVSAHLCEGKCERHVGKVQRVHVCDAVHDHDWGEYWYCQEAIKEDRSRGFTVDIEEV